MRRLPVDMGWCRARGVGYGRRNADNGERHPRSRGADPGLSGGPTQHDANFPVSTLSFAAPGGLRKNARGTREMVLLRPVIREQPGLSAIKNNFVTKRNKKRGLKIFLLQSKKKV